MNTIKFSEYDVHKYIVRTVINNGWKYKHEGTFAFYAEAKQYIEKLPEEERKSAEIFIAIEEE